MAREVLGVAREQADRFHVHRVAFGSTRRAAETAEGLELRDITALERQHVPGVAIDYTRPDAALENVRRYTALGVPFVMGTTGFDAAEARRIVEASGSVAVIAPNMAAPIVAIQAALADVAARFPGALGGYRLEVRESHQAAKADTSGTAKALLASLRGLGCEADEPPIESIRDRGRQLALGVPEEHLGGHGWHWYEAESPAGDVRLALSHCINGRRVYAEGTLLAAAFVAKKVRGGLRGRVFSMADVLAG